MEVDLTTPDDPPESHDQSQDDDTSLVQTLPLDFPSHQLPETGSCNEHGDQDETVPEESSTNHLHTDSKAPGRMQQGAIFSGKILSFCCSECKDDTTYSPNDLLKHFQGAHKGTLPTYPCDLCSFFTNEFSALQRHRIGHRNTLVTCEICNDGVQYSLLWLTRHFTNCHSHNGHFRCKKCEFSTRDAGTFVQHIHHHNERNHKCVKSPHVSPVQGELQRHNQVHSGTFPFSCQICGYSAARKEYLSKHLTVTHGDEVDRTNKWRANEDNSGVNSSGLKLLLKKTPPAGAPREQQWMSKLNSLPAVGLLDQNGRLFNPEKTLEETQQFLERAVGVTKESNKWTKSPLKSEPQCLHPISSTTPQPQKLQEHESSPARELLYPTNSNGLTVLMVKNKISIPPNCTTKVIGFKMVDGKKHLVLKVIPAKQEDSTESELYDSHIGEDKDKTTSNPSSSFSPIIGSLVSLESGESNDTGAKKDLKSSVKEQSKEVENHIDNHLPLIEDCKVSSQKANKAVSPSASKDLTLSPSQSSQSNGRSSPHEVSIVCESERRSNDDIQLESPPNALPGLSSELSCTDMPMAKIESSKDKTILIPSVSADETTISHAKSDPEITIDKSANKLKSQMAADKTTFSVISEESHIQNSDKYCSQVFSEDCESCDDTEENALVKSPLEKNTVHSLLAEEGLDSDKLDTLFETTLSSNTVVRDKIQFPPEVSYASFDSKNITVLNCQSSEVTKKDTNVSPQHKTSTGKLKDAKDSYADIVNNSLTSPSQEVFSFHNYSKDTSGSSPESLQPDEDSPQGLEEEEEECEEDYGDWSLTLPASPPLPNDQSKEDLESSKEGGANDSNPVAESGVRALERVSDSDIEVDECIATVDDSLLPEKERETASSSVTDMNQEGAADMGDRSGVNLNNAAVLGKILEKHSDAIISQQLEKERVRNTVQETVRPTKTTLRILQTPEGKQQMFLQTAENPYAVPVQLKSGAGFKLITKSSSPKINVSYVPGIETPNSSTGVAFTLNGGRIGMAAQNSSGETKGQTAAQMAQGTHGKRFFVNAAALKGPILLSGAVKSSSGEQASNIPQTCYLVKRPLPVSPVNSESTGVSSKTVLATRPVLAMPVNAGDKTGSLQAGRQAYLVRYISPAKSGVLLNNSDGKASNQGNQGNEGRKRVFLRIVRGANGARFLTTAPYTTTTTKKPVYVATSSLQSPCLLMSTSVSTGLTTSNSQGPKLIPVQVKHVISPSNVQMKSSNDHNVALQNVPFIPGPTRPQSLRKRRRRALFEELMESSPKARRMSSKSPADKDATSIWEPAAKDVERTLRLCPFSPLQEIKCPRRNQPVVVLNHPDADIPEVASIMRSVNRYKGDVLKVMLSETTVKALSELNPTHPPNVLSMQNASNSNAGARPRPVGRTVAERFVLKLKLKKTSRNKYEVVRSSSAGSEQQATFCCWFCGRVFGNQEDWIGHGQRHLMEATRDWNKMF